MLVVDPLQNAPFTSKFFLLCHFLDGKERVGIGGGIKVVKVVVCVDPDLENLPSTAPASVLAIGKWQDDLVMESVVIRRFVLLGLENRGEHLPLLILE